MIGKTISHYKIMVKLGEGGMGVVYKAEDTKLKREVAIKFLPRQFAACEEDRKRFKIEAQAAAALNHPNIATIYAIEEVDDELFIVMEYIEGQELKKLLIDNCQLTMDNCLTYANQIAKGLQAAHKKGVVHRDIKSSNIMVTESEQVKIMDFGLAKVGGNVQLTKAGTTLGTAAYMSPEQAHGGQVDHRTDIWSFGVVLYEMLTGQMPFKGDYEQAVLYSIKNEEPEPISSLRTEVPIRLEQIVTKTLMKNPDKRYQHAEEIIRDLETAQKERLLTTSKSRVQRASHIRKEMSGGSSADRFRVYLFASVIALLVLIAFTYYFFKSADETFMTEKSIAVLAFADMSPEKDQEYFCDGMAEELINALAKLPDLRVAARTSAFYFKGRNAPVQTIGEQLNVNSVLEGSVRKDGNKLKITVQLINASDGFHLWSETYNKELKDVFAIQEDISREIVNTLEAKFGLEADRPLVQHYTENQEAYNLYLQGRYFWNKRTNEGSQKSLEYFKRAIEKDSTYALAYAGIADNFLIHGFYDFLPPKTAFSQAKAAVEKALEINENLAEAHTSLAYIKMLFDWDWQGAEEEFKQAIALNPNYAVAHQWYSEFLATMTRQEEAFNEGRRARELDPLSAIVNTNVASLFHYARQYEQAIVRYQKVLEMEPNFLVARFFLSFAYTAQGRYEEAISEAQQGLIISKETIPGMLGALGYAYARAGKAVEARNVLNKLSHLSERLYVSPFGIAIMYAALGENETALEWLEKAYEMRDHWLIRIKVNPVLDDLRSDPKFADLLKKMGFE